LMFPIEDERGRTVAFGARLVPGAPGSEGEGDYKPPKYLNSPESPWFNKRRVLFGLSRAKQAGARKLVVMEGYTDVIACHLAGFQGAVASLGTSFTQDHAKIVERYATEGLVLMFDGDRAGRSAAERALRELVNSRLRVRIAIVGDGDSGAKDPADLVAERPGDDPEMVAVRRESFRELLDHAEDDLTVWFRLLRQRLDLSQAVHVEAAARECADVLALCQEPVRRDAMLNAMARHLAMPPENLKRLLDKLERAPRPAARAEARAGAEDGEFWAGMDQHGPGDDHFAGEQLDPGLPAGAPAPSGGGARPQGGRGPQRPPLRSVAAKAEIELAACVVSDPGLLADLDFDAEPPFEIDGLRALLDLAVEGVAGGRTKRTDLLHFLFARVAEDPARRGLLGEIALRAETILTPRPMLHGLLDGRRRRGEEPRRRVLRQRMQEALAAGDTAAATELQNQLLASMRRELPHVGRASASSAPKETTEPSEPS
jgi:hypothetical protein